MISNMLPLACIFPVGITSHFTPLLLTSFFFFFCYDTMVIPRLKTKINPSHSLSHIWNTLYCGIHMHVTKYCIVFSCSVQPIKLLLSKTWSNGSIIQWPLSQNSLLWIILIPYNWSYKIWYLISNSDTELNYVTFALMSSHWENTELLCI